MLDNLPDDSIFFFFFLFTPVSVAALPLPKKLTHRCLVCTKVLAGLGHKQCVCLHSTRPLAFYGAVIQAWPGNSCGTPSLSLSPPEHWTLANVISLLMLCSTAVKPAYPVLNGMLVLLGFSQWSCGEIAKPITVEHVTSPCKDVVVHTNISKHDLTVKIKEDNKRPQTAVYLI